MSVRRLQDLALTVGAVLGAAFLLMALLSVAFDLRPLFFRSGSMAPTITTGSFAVAQRVPAADLRVGDIVSVTTSTGSRVTHRIVQLDPQGQQVVLTLRGDANTAPDAQTYPVHQADRVFLHAPYLGYAFGWLSGRGLLLLASLVLVLIVVLVRPGTPPATGAGRLIRPRRRRAPGRTSRTAGAVGVAAVITAFPAPSWAAWTNGVTLGGSTFVAHTVPPSPSFTCGGLGAFSVRFNWTAVSGATNYTLHYGTGGSSTLTTTNTTATITSAVSGGTAWVQVNRTFGPVTWTSVASPTRSYRVALVSLCS